jgi:hypothetical protein
MTTARAETSTGEDTPTKPGRACRLGGILGKDCDGHNYCR